MSREDYKPLDKMFNFIPSKYLRCIVMAIIMLGTLAFNFCIYTVKVIASAVLDLVLLLKFSASDYDAMISGAWYWEKEGYWKEETHEQNN